MEHHNAYHIFHLQVYAEDGVFYEGDCMELILPCIDGEKAFLPGHEDAVYAVYTGEMRFLLPPEANGDGNLYRNHDRDHSNKPVWVKAVIGNGVTHFVKNSCVVLAETAERPEDIDMMRAQRALERAQEKLQKDLSMREYRISQMAISRAMARLRAASRNERGE